MKKTSLSPRADGRFFRQNCEIFGIFPRKNSEIFGRKWENCEIFGIFPRKNCEIFGRKLYLCSENENQRIWKKELLGVNCMKKCFNGSRSATEVQPC